MGKITRMKVRLTGYDASDHAFRDINADEGRGIEMAPSS